MAKKSSALTIESERLRTFVAVWPDADALAKIRALSQEILSRRPGNRTRITPADRIHATLAFIGDTDAEERSRILSELQSMQAIPTPWILKELGVFKKSGILWLGGPSEELIAQAGQVRAFLKKKSIPFDPKPFRAHITIARGWNGEIPFELPSPIICRLSKPCLVVSLRDENGRLHYLPLQAHEASGQRNT